MSQQALFGHPNFCGALAMSFADLGLTVFAPSSYDAPRPAQPATPAVNAVRGIDQAKRLAQAEEAFDLFRKASDVKQRLRRLRTRRILLRAALVVASNLALAAVVAESVLLF